MTQWLGNLQGQKLIQDFLNPENQDRVCFLTGPHSLGKRSFVTEQLSLLPEEDTIFVEPGVDGARQAFDFLSTRPVIAPFRVVAVAGTDLMQLPAQDAYLKILEEPPFLSKIIFISDDDGLLSAPLKSRARLMIRWKCLSDNEMIEFADTFGKIDEIAICYSCGRPGIYAIIHDDQRIKPFAELIKQALCNRKNLLLEKIPVIIAEIDSKSPMRIPLSQILMKVVSDCINEISTNKLSIVLKYASQLYSSPSLNAELHYLRMCSDLNS
jgi:DNA polymerase-3 subunit delta'